MSYLITRLHSPCFFFFKQKTAYEKGISNWSSDVCSSDLQGLRPIQPDALQRRAAALVGRLRLAVARQRPDREKTRDHRDQKRAGDPDQIFVAERLDRPPDERKSGV